MDVRYNVSHEVKNEMLKEQQYRIKALIKRVDILEKEIKLKSLTNKIISLESQIDDLNQEIVNINFKQTVK
tara:strand:+ start:510 stop:722 length:213 start_codon:yes stop_codon:yes gene_type:complete